MCLFTHINSVESEFITSCTQIGKSYKIHRSWKLEGQDVVKNNSQEVSHTFQILRKTQKKEHQ